MCRKSYCMALHTSLSRRFPRVMQFCSFCLVLVGRASYFGIAVRKVGVSLLTGANDSLGRFVFGRERRSERVPYPTRSGVVVVMALRADFDNFKLPSVDFTAALKRKLPSAVGVSLPKQSRKRATSGKSRWLSRNRLRDVTLNSTSNGRYSRSYYFACSCS